ncbi:MAG: hypothetical protein GWM98_11625 [Nitrospinaceae bacterium]|nr:hypothetical protein [Nitrospinaceae bacterium]NIR55033.1 hypothetical protein [Nitrospinaceae bacterium]NIS85432.1 hypothetical protein [Nitrospinaceae bacterium]NIT82271.1 hypothetical protein [Nitrospinaceae bacterium]NIU44501.1 hypothetical protein [Nitrospinaceae bacterium]
MSKWIELINGRWHVRKNYYEAGGPAKMDDLGLTYPQRTNSQKLRYWGLAAPVLDGEKKHKRGWWQITEKGSRFARRETSIYKTVVMKNNEFQRWEGDLVFIDQVIDGYEYRGDYQGQARQQILF